MRIHSHSHGTFESHHVTCRCEWCVEQQEGDAQLTDDPRKLANAAAKSVRSQGLRETLSGLQTMGMAAMGMSAEQYKHMIRGVARQMIRDGLTLPEDEDE